MTNEDIDDMLKEGWEIITPPVKFTPEMYHCFLQLFDDNYYLLDHGFEKEGDAVYIRVSLIASPEAIARVENKAKWFADSVNK